LLIRKKNPIKYLTQNENYIENAIKNGKGVILLSAHIGNFEIAGEILSERINAKVNVLMVERDSEKMKRLYENANKNRNVNIKSKKKNPLEVALEIKNALQNGEIVAALGDRYIDDNVSEIEFLGQKAKFPRGIFEIACITKTPIIPVFTIRQSAGVYKFSAKEPIEICDTDRKRRKEFIYEAMCEYVRQVEKQAAQTPLQWYNFYRFWD
jgi:predicted LPLAT superfamily acyltransferase